jgi:hypothetical protein
VLAHQYLAQADETVGDAILGNAGTIITFRTGLNDALVLEKEFHPEFTAHDLVNLPNYHIYLKLMIDGVVRSRSAPGHCLRKQWICSIHNLDGTRLVRARETGQ